MTALPATQETQETQPGDPFTPPSHEGTEPVSRLSSIVRVIPRPLRSTPFLLLVLAFVFIAPGLPPFNVALPMQQALVFPPWQAAYPDVSVLFRGGDPLFQQIPWRHWAQDEFAAGRFPLWNDAAFGGAPVFAYYQSAILYPLNLLWILVPVSFGMGIIMALKLWLAGLGMWLFLRAMRLHPTACLLGAIAFMFCGSMVKWLPWAHTNVFLVMPWLAWAIYAWCVQDKRAALAGFAIATTWAVLGGHPENLSIVMLTSAIWAVGLIVSSPPRRWLRQAGGLLVAGLVGLAIGAIQILPFLEAYGLSHISVDPQRALLWRAHIEAGASIEWILPRWWGQVYDGVIDGPLSFNDINYIGLAPILGLFFAGLALARRKLNLGLSLPWLVVGIFAWIITYDDYMGKWVRQLPLFSHSLNMRWVFSVGFAVLVLGAFGWDWFARWVEEKSQRKNIELHMDGIDVRRPLFTPLIVLGLVMLVVGIATLLEHWLGVFQQPDVSSHLATADYRFYWGIWTVGVVLALAGATLLWSSGWLGQRTSPVMGLVVSTLLIADLWMLLFTFNPGSPSDQYYPATSFITQMKAQLPPTERVVMEGEVLPANSGLIFNIRDWRYQDPMLSERDWRAANLLSPGLDKDVWDWYNMFLPHVRMEVASMFGIRYIVYPKDINPAYWEPDPIRPPYKRLAYTEGLGLWEIEGVPGFAYLSDNVEAVPGEPEATGWLRNLTWEKVRTYPAMVEAPASAIADITNSGDDRSPGSANVLGDTPGHISIETNAQRPALLVVAESYYPGWHATLDGQPVELLRANYISQGVVVPVGRHTVELKYEPGSVRYGTLGSLAGLLGLAGLIIWWRRGSRRL